ncbi:MAG: imidazole glycerol phosphate synthase subunit HisF [Thermoleophilia bacterium]|nr:imidazole glycerol phosphate synthase subunit HisF [Thermoleophilia bacterium]
MSRPRLVPVLLVKHGLLVRSQGFGVHQVIGNPGSAVERFSHWNVDELILIDISTEDRHGPRRDDPEVRPEGSTGLDVLRAVAPACHMPLSVGGRIRTMGDITDRLAAGADRVVLTTAPVETPELIAQGAARFGSRCIVVGIDALRRDDGKLEALIHGGRTPTGLHPAELARELERMGAGEILLNSVDRDGCGHGYDLSLIQEVTRAVRIPVIACGGVGRYEHVPAAITSGGASAAAAASIFHLHELSYPNAKQACIAAGIPMRPVRLGSRHFPREPGYDTTRRDGHIAERYARARTPLPRDTEPPAAPPRWCSRCAHPSLSAVPLEFDDEGVCTGCRAADMKARITPAEWSRRTELLIELLERHRSRDGSRHDCVIPVSGGRDGWYQAHVIKKELGFNPLLVTYDGNNWTPAGRRNMLRMREVFGVDHVLVSPSVPTLQKLNRLAFVAMGDMNWHAHVGITTAPVRVAVQHGIPLVIWGEHGHMDLGARFGFDDFPEMSHRDRLEHFARGYEWNWFTGLEGLRAADLITYMYPADRQLMDVGVRGPYLGDFVHWEADVHTRMVIDEYGFETGDEPFDRTYRRVSDLDDMHENGVHDWLRYLRSGHGRVTDHVCEDIRAGLMTRREGIELVRRHDPVKPRDLERWLAYTGMTEREFDRIADTFRDPRVWWRENGEWKRHEIPDPVSATCREPMAA